MSEIPPEIFREILLRLPAESLFRFRTVCKAWRRLIDNPSFVKAHAHKYNQLSSNTLVIRDSTGELFYSLSLDDRHTIDAIPVKQLIRRRGSPWLPRLPMASCNGLILIWDSYVWEIWNPLTSDCLKLPQPDIGDIIYLMAIGIGYDYAADDYEVVRIDDFSRDGVIVYRTLVYSMKLGSWRMIKDCPYDIRWGCEGVFLNGALHWTSRDMIVAFNLETEDYGQLKLPPVQSRPEPARSVHLDVLGGCLVLTYYHRTMDHFDGWVMNDYGVEKSWAKLFSLRKLDIVGAWSRLRPVAYLKGKRQILLQHDGGFFWLDVEDNSIKKVTVHGASGISSAQICPGSLFRLDVGGSVAGNRKGVKRKRKPSRNTVDTMLKFCVRDASIWCCSDYSCCTLPSRSLCEGEDWYFVRTYFGWNQRMLERRRQVPFAFISILVIEKTIYLRFNRQVQGELKIMEVISFFLRLIKFALGDEASWDMIIEFDLGTEDYRLLPLPEARSTSQPRKVHLDALGGCLILGYYCLITRCFDGWVMNDYKSWMKLFSLGELNIPGALSRLRPAAYLKGKRQNREGVKRKRTMKRKRAVARFKSCVRDVDEWYSSDSSCGSSGSSWSSEGFPLHEEWWLSICIPQLHSALAIQQLSCSYGNS